MKTPQFEIDNEIEFYYNYKTSYRWTYVMWELLANADRVINSVYLFKHFDEYCWQLNSNRQEDKLEVYWKASYHEKLIDYIKIVVAFETMNKALLLKNGYLIHKIDHTYDKKLHRKCKLPQKQYVLKVDKKFNFKNVNDEKKHIQSCADCRHPQRI